METLTIFTPTYNRAYILGRLYNSLVKQTCQQFVWLVVDDGSDDDTTELFQKWKNEGKIRIQYYRIKNGGKSHAHNYAVESCSTSYFTCVDSDDYLIDEAVEEIYKGLEEAEQLNCIGCVFPRKKPNGQPIAIWPENLKKSTLMDSYCIYGAKGDTMLIYQTKILKKFRFPSFEGEKFVPESYLYDQIDQLGEMLFVHKAIYVGDYLDDGYTNSMAKLIAHNPKGYLCYIEQRLQLDNGLKQIFLDEIRYTAIYFVIYRRLYIRKMKFPFYAFIASPFGYLLYKKRYAEYLIK